VQGLIYVLRRFAVGEFSTNGREPSGRTGERLAEALA